MIIKLMFKQFLGQIEKICIFYQKSSFHALSAFFNFHRLLPLKVCFIRGFQNRIYVPKSPLRVGNSPPPHYAPLISTRVFLSCVLLPLIVREGGHMPIFHQRAKYMHPKMTQHTFFRCRQPMGALEKRPRSDNFRTFWEFWETL